MLAWLIVFRKPKSDLHIRDNAVKAYALKASTPEKGVHAAHEQTPVVLAMCSSPEQFFWPHLTDNSTGKGRHVDVLACNIRNVRVVLIAVYQ